jgi:hypothetical protein
MHLSRCGSSGRHLTCAAHLAAAHFVTFDFFYGPNSGKPSSLSLTREEIDRLWDPKRYYGYG